MSWIAHFLNRRWAAARPELDQMMNEQNESDGLNGDLSVAEHELLQNQLRLLPDTPPPREVWQRIEEQARAEGLFQPAFWERGKWLAGAGLAAAVVLTVLNIPLTPVVDSVDELPTEPPLAAANENVVPHNLSAMNALMVESRQIEQDLRSLPSQPSLVRAGTAATIAEIEEQIAAIDFTLNHADLNLTPDQREVYWRERVRLMNSLLRLRTAQAQRVSF